MNVLLLTSHAIAEYDDLRMLTDLGYDVFSIGGAYDEVPFEGKRPALDVARFPDLEEATHRQRARLSEELGDPGLYIDWGKARLHPDIIDWADVIIVHHFPERWIGGQWEQIKHKRVIWRTCGQSSPDGSLERFMAQFPVEIVRYSPNERVLPDFAGEDALIRFGKYPDDYGPWVGDEAVIGNITQHMAQRGDHCGIKTWRELTYGLPAVPAGPGSEEIGGLGPLPYPEMLTYLRRIRGYLYTGTWPASYTLGLMEAMLSGVPVVTVPWNDPTATTYPTVLERLYEATDILPRRPVREAVPAYFKALLKDRDMAARHGEECRQAAIELFDVATVGPQWKAFLG